MSGLSKLNVLISFPYLTKEILSFIAHHQDDINFILDSGAFTAWKAGKVVRLKDYMKCLELMPVKPFRYFMLDVIGDPKKTQENLKVMLDEGLNPIPIFTRGESLDMLEHFYEVSDLVAIGGLVGTPKNRGFVKWMMNNGIKNRKVHWLGFTNQSFIMNFRPYSVDSSSRAHDF